jgi:hypothetical protein
MYRKQLIRTSWFEEVNLTDPVPTADSLKVTHAKRSGHKLGSHSRADKVGRQGNF